MRLREKRSLTIISTAIITSAVEKNVAFLASDVGRLFRKRFEIATRDLGVTGPQWRALVRIHENPGINQGALAALLEVEAITAGRMIDRLEKLGLVERRPDPADRRVWLIHLTTRASPLLDALRGRAAEVIAESISIFTTEEQATLVALLTRMRENLLEPCTETAEILANG
jgi:DNA-binding MarR family transcriptional regulator